MNIYYNIQSPIQSDKTLRKIVDAYLSKNVTESFYSRAVTYGVKDSEFDTKEFSIFRRKINTLELDRIRKLDERKVKKYSIAKKSFILNTLLEKQIGKAEAVQYPTYEQYKLVMKYSNEEILDRYDAIKNGTTDSLSKEDKAILNLIDGYLIENRHKFKGLAGYHVYADTLEDYAETNGDLKYKIYLNLPYNQLYKFADKYMEICRDKKIPYTFKLMSPISDSPKRSERMCIYCEKETFYQTIDIIRAIKSANPELAPNEPPIMAGILDGWIGIGSDPAEASYNQYRADCIERALEKYFSGIPTDKAKRMLKNNPQILDEIRNAIEQEAREMRIATTKFCFTKVGNMSIKEQDKNYRGRKFKIDHSKLRIQGLAPDRLRIDGMAARKPKKKKRRINDAMFNQYARTRIEYGIDSPEMQDLLNMFVCDINTLYPDDFSMFSVDNCPNMREKKSRQRQQQPQRKANTRNNSRVKRENDFSPFEL